MSAISSTSYVLPAPRPWDPRRHDPSSCLEDWVEGKIVKGHPNICPLIDFFEDNHYYYLVLPSTTPEHQPGGAVPPSDLFDLVETYPQGLPPHMIRSFLGQIADALYFLHSQGIGASSPIFCNMHFNHPIQFTAMSKMKMLFLVRREPVS